MTHHMTHRSGAGTQCPQQWEGSEPTTALSADYRGLQRAGAGCEQLHTLFPEKTLDTRQSPLRSQTPSMATCSPPRLSCVSLGLFVALEAERRTSLF